MIIKAVYIGNEKEAYIERRFRDGMNIVFSDDNHVGKSVVIQGLMYALGSDALFSSTLNYKEYYFAVDFEAEGESYSVLRQKDTFAIRVGDELFPFDTVSEFRGFWNARIFPLPSIILNGEDHVVGLSLYNQMYFTSQSERSSSQITNPGLYKKADFIEMLYSIAGLAGRSIPEDEEDSLKAERDELKALKQRLIRKSKTFNVSDPALAVISPIADEVSRAEVVKALEKLTEEVAELRKRRNRLYNRMKKNEVTLKELRSLNQNISAGHLVCLDCGSQQIGFELSDSKMVFDVTTAELRKQIIDSMQEKISAYQEEIRVVEHHIRSKQERIANLFEEKDITIGDVIIYKDDYAEMAQLDLELTRVVTRLDEIESILKSNRANDKSLQQLQKGFMEDILEKMNWAHNQLCLGEEHGDYASLFTTSSEAFTGSELTEYVLSRTYALSTCLHHGCPIVVDSFRAEDLSSAREEKALRLFNGLDNQVIFTTTIKDEEHDKYRSFEFVNPIDYSGFESYKILQPSYLGDFLEKLSSFGISIKA